jgi:hypothetical protein
MTEWNNFIGNQDRHSKKSGQASFTEEIRTGII